MQPTLLYKKFLCVFMSLMLVLFSTQSVYATTSLGGWTALDTITAGATNTINATKTAGGKVLKSAVTIAPQAANVGKHLIKGGGAAALAFAMVELADGAIDWVLDPANNAVKYKNPAYSPDAGGDGSAGAYGYYVVRTAGNGTAPANVFYNTADAACRGDIVKAGKEFYSYYTNGDCWAVLNSGQTWFGVVNYKDKPSNPAPVVPSKEYISIPIDSVAAKVIANAEAGHAPSQEAVKATALEGFAAGEHDAALDAAAVPGTGVENPPVDTPTDPAKPFDPSSILSALSGISAVLAGIMSSLTGFVDWWQAQWTTFSTAITDFNTWVRAEPDTASLQPEPVEVSEGTLVDGWQDKANAGYVNLGSTQCPSDVLIPISYMGASTNLSISYVPFCHFASIIRYAVILGAWVAALMIISGGRTRE